MIDLQMFGGTNTANKTANNTYVPTIWESELMSLRSSPSVFGNARTMADVANEPQADLSAQQAAYDAANQNLMSKYQQIGYLQNQLAAAPYLNDLAAKNDNSTSRLGYALRQGVYSGGDTSAYNTNSNGYTRVDTNELQKQLDAAQSSLADAQKNASRQLSLLQMAQQTAANRPISQANAVGWGLAAQAAENAGRTQAYNQLTNAANAEAARLGTLAAHPLLAGTAR